MSDSRTFQEVLTSGCLMGVLSFGHSESGKSRNEMESSERIRSKQRVDKSNTSYQNKAEFQEVSQVQHPVQLMTKSMAPDKEAADADGRKSDCWLDYAFPAGARCGPACIWNIGLQAPGTAFRGRPGHHKQGVTNSRP